LVSLWYLADGILVNMATRVLSTVLKPNIILRVSRLETQSFRLKTTTRSGKILPEPKTNLRGLIIVPAMVIPGLLTGACISKAFANFLEENELFVPEDDDDDDD